MSENCSCKMRFFLSNYLDLHTKGKKKMKHISYIGILLTIFITASCGEDRSGEFYALIEDRIWMEETMRKNYLWYEDIPTIENENDYFQAPATFFKNMLSKNALNGKGDIYSYMEESAVSDEESRSLMLDRTSTYGIEFELTSDPTGTTTHTVARILYVLPESPAAMAGIQRGDWITAINKNHITSDNYQLLINGGQTSWTRDRLIATENGVAWQAQDTLQIGTSIPLEINPFFVDTLYHSHGKNIAYLVYNELSTGPNNDGYETVYQEQMKQIFAKFKSQSPDAFVLDLRYNNGGFLSCAQTLGSLLAPASALGKDFINLTRNDLTAPQTISYLLDATFADANLNLDKIYILTGRTTASSSEAVINGLIPYLGTENVILIGTQTTGKNVAMSAFANEAYGLTMWPVVAYVSNANNESNYANGFKPQYSLNESNQLNWMPLGNTEEFYLKNTISLITTGYMPDIPATEKASIKPFYTSVETRRNKGTIINVMK